MNPPDQMAKMSLLPLKRPETAQSGGLWQVKDGPNASSGSEAADFSTLMADADASTGGTSLPHGGRQLPVDGHLNPQYANAEHVDPQSATSSVTVPGHADVRTAMKHTTDPIVNGAAALSGKT
ncbi:MAG: hypothetical protein AAF525_13045, partial [Pseudomonadota bacterium]